MNQRMTSPINNPLQQQQPITEPSQQHQPFAQPLQQQMSLTQSPQQQQHLTQPKQQQQPFTQFKHMMPLTLLPTHHNLCKSHITQAPPYPVDVNVPLQMPTQFPLNMQSMPLPSHGMNPLSEPWIPLGVTLPMSGIPAGAKGIEKDILSQNENNRGSVLLIQMNKSDTKPNITTTVFGNSNSPSISNDSHISVLQMPPLQMVGTSQIQEHVQSNNVLQEEQVQDRQIDLSQSNIVKVDYVSGKQIVSVHASERVNVVKTEHRGVYVLSENSSDSGDKNEVVRQVTPEVIVSPVSPVDFNMDLDKKSEDITTESSSVSEIVKAEKKSKALEIKKKGENILSPLCDAYTDESAVIPFTTCPYPQWYNNTPTYYNTNANQSESTPFGTTQTNLVSKQERRNRISIIDPITGQDVAFEKAVQKVSDPGSRSSPVGKSTEPTSSHSPNNEIAAQFVAEVAKTLKHTSMNQRMTSPIKNPLQQQQPITEPPHPQPLVTKTSQPQQSLTQSPLQQQPLTQPKQQQEPLTQFKHMMPLTLHPTHHNLGKSQVNLAPRYPVKGNVPLQMTTHPALNMHSLQSLRPPSHGMSPLAEPWMPLGVTRPGIPVGADGIVKEIQSQKGDYKAPVLLIDMDKSDKKTKSATAVFGNSNSPSLSNNCYISVPQIPPPQMVGRSKEQVHAKLDYVLKEDQVQNKKKDSSQSNSVNVDYVFDKQIESVHGSERVNVVKTNSTRVSVLSDNSSDSRYKNEVVRQVTQEVSPVDFNMDLDKKPEEITESSSVQVSEIVKAEKKSKALEIKKRGENIFSSLCDAYIDESAVWKNNKPTYYNTNANHSEITTFGTTQTSLVSKKERRNRISIIDPITGQDVAFEKAVQKVSDPGSRSSPVGKSTEPTSSHSPNNEIAAQFAAEVAKTLKHPSMNQRLTSPINNPLQQQQPITEPPHQQPLVTQTPQQHQPFTQPQQQQPSLTQSPQQKLPFTQPKQQQESLTQSKQMMLLTQPPIHHNLGKSQITLAPPYPVEGNVPLQMTTHPPLIMHSLQSLHPPSHGMSPLAEPWMPLEVIRPMPGIPVGAKGIVKEIQSQKGDYKGQVLLIDMDSSDTKPNSATAVFGNSNSPNLSNILVPQRPTPQTGGRRQVQEHFKSNNVLKEDKVQDKQIDSSQSHCFSVDYVSGKQIESLHASERVNVVKTESTGVSVLSENSSDYGETNEVARQVTKEITTVDFNMDFKPAETATKSSSVLVSGIVNAKTKAKDREINKKGENISSSLCDEQSAVLPQQQITTQAGVHQIPKQLTTYAQGYFNTSTNYNTNDNHSQRTSSGTNQTSLVSKRERVNRIQIIDPKTGQNVTVESAANASNSGSRSTPIGNSTEPTLSQYPKNEIAAQFAAEVDERVNHQTIQQWTTTFISSPLQQEQPLTQHPSMMQQSPPLTFLNLVYQTDKAKKKSKDKEINNKVENTSSSLGDGKCAVERQTVTDLVRPLYSTEINPIGQQVEHLANILQQLMQGSLFAPFGQVPHHQPYYPRSLTPGGEGSRVQGDGSIPTNHTSQFKKTRDETLTQNVVDILNNCMKSVGCLNTPFQKGTAFRVGDRYVITAFHVIQEVTYDMYTKDSRTVVNPGWSIPFVYVNFNECLDHPSHVLYRLRPPCFTDSELDVAILEIVDPNSLLPPPLPLSKTGGPKSKVSIIGYGHPGPNSKHLDPNCPVLAPDSDRVLRAIYQVISELEEIKQNLKNPDIVDFSFEGYDDPKRFLLNCFFEHGGSGGPAIDHEVPASTTVVGIYIRGFPTFFFDLPKHLQDRYRDEFRFEMCTRTSSLYLVLLASDEALTKNIFG